MFGFIQNKIRGIIKRLNSRYYRLCVDHYPKIIIEKSWKKDFGYSIDWEHPRDINEKRGNCDRMYSDRQKKVKLS